jgi:hypothetical protein
MSATQLGAQRTLDTRMDVQQLEKQKLLQVVIQVLVQGTELGLVPFMG